MFNSIANRLRLVDANSEEIIRTANTILTELELLEIDSNAPTTLVRFVQGQLGKKQSQYSDGSVDWPKLVMPANCNVEQVISQRKPIVDEDRWFLVQELLW